MVTEVWLVAIDAWLVVDIEALVVATEVWLIATNAWLEVATEVLAAATKVCLVATEALVAATEAWVVTVDMLATLRPKKNTKFPLGEGNSIHVVPHPKQEQRSACSQQGGACPAGQR